MQHPPTLTSVEPRSVVQPLSSLRPPGSIQVRGKQPVIKKAVPKIPVPINSLVPKCSIQPAPSTLKCNIRPPSRPSNLVPSPVQPLSSFRPAGSLRVRAKQSVKPVPKIPVPIVWSQTLPPNNRQLSIATSAHPHVHRTSFRPPFNLCPAWSQANVDRSYFFWTEYFLLNREMFWDQGWTEFSQIGDGDWTVLGRLGVDR